MAADIEMSHIPMRRTFTAIAIFSVSIASPANAQPLIDNLRNLKGSVEGLVGSNKSVNAEKKIQPDSVSATEQKPTVRYDVGSFAVAGIRLGMTPVEVRTIMEQKGFSVVETTEADRFTFAGLAKTEANRLMKASPDLPTITGPAELKGAGNSRNRLTIRFLQTSVGPLASTIKLTFDHDTNDIGRLEGDLANRYGLVPQNVGELWIALV